MEMNSRTPPSIDQPPDRIDPNVGWANRVLRHCIVNEETGCWEWQRATSSKGYGRVKQKGSLMLPYRLVAVGAGLLTEAAGDDPNCLILHECDNPSCCNPDHMKVGTQSENMKDCVARGRWHRGRPKPSV